MLHVLEVNPQHSQSHAELFEQVDGVPNHLAMLRLALGRDPELPPRQGALTRSRPSGFCGAGTTASCAAIPPSRTSNGCSGRYPAPRSR